MRKEFTTNNSNETRELGRQLAKEIKNGGIVCLSGDLGSGKTTFAQGMLEGLRVEGPYTSPTFLIMKEYKRKMTNDKFPMTNIFHIDAYRVGSDDIINLGWEEIVGDSRNVVIIEWANRVKKIIPKGALWIEFEWADENKRKISFKAKG